MTRVFLFLVCLLIAEAPFCESSCRDTDAQRSDSDDTPSLRNPAREILKRYSDIDYDSFVGLMGRRGIDTDEVPSPVKREMHDIFVGLMGRRNSETGTGRPWRTENAGTRGIFFNKCKLRFRRGLQ